MNCQKRRAQIALYVGGDLPREKAGALSCHLVECAECREAERQLRESQDLIKGLNEEPLPDAIFQQVQQQVLARISAGLKPSAPFQSFLTSPFRRSVQWAGAVLAFVLVIGMVVGFWRQNSHISVKEELPQVASKKGVKSGQTSALSSAAEKPEIKKPAKKSVVSSATSNPRGPGPSLSKQLKNTTAPDNGQDRNKTDLAEIYQEMALWQELESKRQEWEEQSKKEKSVEAKDKVVAKLTTNDPNIVIYWLVDAGKGNTNEIKE